MKKFMNLKTVMLQETIAKRILMHIYLTGCMVEEYQKEGNPNFNLLDIVQIIMEENKWKITC